MTYYRKGDLRPVDCERCECQQFRWNGRSRVLAIDPPSTCECDHVAAHHRFRPCLETGEYPS